MIEYFIKFNVYLGVFYIFYLLLMRNDTRFAINRFYLLSAIVISGLLPFISVPLPSFLQTGTEAIKQYTIDIPSSSAAGITQVPVEISFWAALLSKIKVITLIYLIGCVFFLSKLTVSIIRLYRIMSRSNINYMGYYSLVSCPGIEQPFSFLRWVFIDENKYEKNEFAQIVNHERVHVRKGHTYDVLFLELLSIVLWINPVLHFVKHSIIAIHEFEADNEVTINSNRTEYARLIVKHVSAGMLYSTGNYFSNSTLKRRLTMINRTKSGKSTLFKSFLVIPFVLLAMLAFADEAKVITIDLSDTDNIEEILENLKVDNGSGEQMNVVVQQNEDGDAVVEVIEEIKLIMSDLDTTVEGNKNVQIYYTTDGELEENVVKTGTTETKCYTYVYNNGEKIDLASSGGNVVTSSDGKTIKVETVTVTSNDDDSKANVNVQVRKNNETLNATSIDKEQIKKQAEKIKDAFEGTNFEAYELELTVGEDGKVKKVKTLDASKKDADVEKVISDLIESIEIIGNLENKNDQKFNVNIIKSDDEEKFGKIIIKSE